MDSQPGPSAHIVGTLAAFGVEVDEVDTAVIEAAWQEFGPEMRGLLDADLEAVEPEPDVDPSKPPR